jgi:2-phosphosulfolactate phosphatase
MLAASFVVAGATVKFVNQCTVEEVTFVITGKTFRGGDEDLACAEYLEELFRGHQPDTAPFVQRVFDSRDALQHLDPLEIAFPRSDLDYCTHIDKFDFAMPIRREDGRLRMTCIRP